MTMRRGTDYGGMTTICAFSNVEILREIFGANIPQITVYKMFPQTMIEKSRFLVSFLKD
jgi:hypothetical protein